MNKEKFHFHEYFNEGFGHGWGLYCENEPTSYYIFLKDYISSSILASSDYELFYGNGFYLGSNESLEFLKDLTIQLFKSFPKMSSSSGFDVEEFKNMKILISIAANARILGLKEK